MSKGHLLRFIIISISVMLSYAVKAFDPQPGTPLANHEHPRLHITSSRINDVRQKISTYYFNEYQDYVNYFANQGVNSENNNIDITYNTHIFDAAMVHHAFIAAIGPVPGINYPITLDQFARRAIDALTNGLNNGQGLGYPGVLAYDWTYNFMNSTERQNIAMMMRDRYLSNSHVDNGYSIANPQLSTIESLFSSKAFESIYAFYAGLAVWGDGYYDFEADLAVDTFYDLMLNFGFIDAQNFVSESNGGWSEWYQNYALFRVTYFMLLDGWRTATGEDYISQLHGATDGDLIKSYGSFIYYVVDPFKYHTSNGNYDGYTYISLGGGGSRDVNLFESDNLFYLYLFPKGLSEGGATTEAGLLRGFAERYNVPQLEYEENYLYGFLGLLRSIPSVTPEQSGLPHYRWMKNFGVFVARTGFSQQSDGVFMVVDSHFLIDGHSGPSEFPGFSLNKFGELVNKRRVTHRGYGNLNDYPGAIDANIVMFDGNHTASKSVIRSKNDLQAAFNGSSNYELGGIEQVTAKDDKFYHVHVDRSLSFNNGVHHTREFVWLPGQTPYADSDFLVVYDRTSSPTEPTWVYHVPWRPGVSGYSSTVDLTTGTGTSDRIGAAYIGSGVIVKELNGTGGEKDGRDCQGDSTGGAGAHGVLFAKTLLPDQARIEVTRVAQFDNDVCSRQRDFSLKSHRWQIGVRPTQTNSENRFLNVFETADANLKSSMQTAVLVSSGAFDGAFIERRTAIRPNLVVLFNKNDGVHTTSVTYSVNGQGTLRHIITGLQPHTLYGITDSATGTSFDKATETNVQYWDYKGVAQNLHTGVLYFETSINGSHTFNVTPLGSTGSIPDEETNPEVFSVLQNYPNPFNGNTTIYYQLFKSIEVRLVVYNVLGQKTRTLLDGKIEAGNHRMVWDGLDDEGHAATSGVYICRFEASDFKKTIKMLLMK
jgi:FlgD Ig-like domain